MAAQHVSGARHEEALTCAYEAWSRLAASELILFLGIDGRKQVDVARKCSGRDVKTRWVVPVASLNADVCDVEVSKRAWCISRDHLTDLLCVVQKRVFPSYASQVGRALMRVLRRWPDEFGVQCLVICLSKLHLRDFEDGGSGLSRLCQTRGSLRFNGPRAEISFHFLFGDDRWGNDGGHASARR